MKTTARCRWRRCRSALAVATEGSGSRSSSRSSQWAHRRRRCRCPTTLTSASGRCCSTAGPLKEIDILSRWRKAYRAMQGSLTCLNTRAGHWLNRASSAVKWQHWSHSKGEREREKECKVWYDKKYKLAASNLEERSFLVKSKSLVSSTTKIEF